MSDSCMSDSCVSDSCVSDLLTLWPMEPAPAPAKVCNSRTKPFPIAGRAPMIAPYPCDVRYARQCRQLRIERTWRGLLELVEDCLPKNGSGSFIAFADGATGAEEKSDVVHDLLAYLAAEMIRLHKEKRTYEVGSTQVTVINERIAVTDRLIDEIVYRLYGLTEDEIAIVERTP